MKNLTLELCLDHKGTLHFDSDPETPKPQPQYTLDLAHLMATLNILLR